MRLYERMQKFNENMSKFEAAIRVLANHCKYPNNEFDERLKQSLMFQCADREARLHCFELAEDATLIPMISEKQLNQTLFRCMEQFVS